MILRFNLKKLKVYTLSKHLQNRQLVPLELLTVGERGRICDLDGDRELIDRLAEMGVRQGVEIHIVQTGSPCIVAFDNHRLSFRGDEAANILVEVFQQ